MDWKRFAACIGRHDIEWFPTKPGGGRGMPPGYAENLANARKLCATCPVRRACLNDALETRDPGIRAGTTDRERRRMRARRAS